MLLYRTKLQEKLKESLNAVLPIMGIVLLLCFTIVPTSPSILMAFIIGAVLLVVGMTFFSLGAELAMTPMGERVGSCMTKTKRLWIMIVLGFVLGFIITISEPDLQVLANQVPSIANEVLIIAVAFGVGIFLIFALLRMLFSIPLSYMLFFFYIIVFSLAFFVPKDFLAVAFDSGGVTTGPMTVPFIMALGIGISTIRSDKHAVDDSFGLVALCSIGPIMAVLLLGLVFHPSGGEYVPVTIPEIENSIVLRQLFSSALPTYMMEIAVSLLPIVIFFGIFQIVSLRLSKKALIKILIGLIYTYVGLVLFLTGVNVGFMPAGNYLGQMIAALPYRFIIVPIGMVIGYFIVMAEPAVYVLTKQVEELTDSAIPASAMKHSLSISVACSVGLAMLRVLTGISIFWFIIPGYAIALGLSFFVPKIFTAIAFDSGGVASGPMTATFLLPFAMGACVRVGGNIVTDAFGVVAMVAMTPLITIQILGLIYRIQERSSKKFLVTAPAAAEFELLDDYDIIEL
ncbi:DUF1538 domain-containing protein [Diplocloster modestus]|uniref:DUF1538 domain-containing protein n=1 Tax=Diplocloster modestus TaxID=2850322 RepID=A0ABS6K6M4_9FIRM|nr:DUF1538 domain-containing protein [Diplocloster modestus]MBU9726101.1 DUF1538 domain-containing protein [Diplocloster modestus]